MKKLFVLGFLVLITLSPAVSQAMFVSLDEIQGMKIGRDQQEKLKEELLYLLDPVNDMDLQEGTIRLDDYTLRIMSNYVDIKRDPVVKNWLKRAVRGGYGYEKTVAHLMDAGIRSFESLRIR